MIAEVAALWTDRLRSGTIKQATKVLAEKDGSRCCLGVLCDIAVENGLVVQKIDDESSDVGYVDQATGRCFDTTLPFAVKEAYGMETANGGFDIECDDHGVIHYALSDLNDSGLSFAQIADVIEHFADVL